MTPRPTMETATMLFASAERRQISLCPSTCVWPSRFFTLQADPVTVVPLPRTKRHGDHRHATRGADRWPFVLHTQSMERTLRPASGNVPRRLFYARRHISRLPRRRPRIRLPTRRVIPSLLSKLVGPLAACCIASSLSQSVTLIALPADRSTSRNAPRLPEISRTDWMPSW